MTTVPRTFTSLICCSSLIIDCAKWRERSSDEIQHAHVAVAFASRKAHSFSTLLRCVPPAGPLLGNETRIPRAPISRLYVLRVNRPPSFTFPFSSHRAVSDVMITSTFVTSPFGSFAFSFESFTLHPCLSSLNIAFSDLSCVLFLHSVPFKLVLLCPRPLHCSPDPNSPPCVSQCCCQSSSSPPPSPS